MTNYAPAREIRLRASWPVSVLCGVGGMAYTVAAVADEIAVSRISIDVGVAGGLLPRLVGLAAVVCAVIVALSLPRRARAAFVTGVVVPVVVAGALLAVVLYSLANNPDAFTF